MRKSVRYAASVLLFLAVAPGPRAQTLDEAGAGLTVSVGPAVLLGYVDELVYRSDASGDLLSRLRWQLLPASGLRADLRYAPWARSPLSFSLRVLGLLPTPTGTMVDEDWDAPVTGDTLVYGRSRHGAYLSRGIDATLSLDIRARSERSLAEVGFGASVTSLSWEGWNGSGEYDYQIGSDSAIDFYGLVIAYQTLALGPSLGMAIEQELGSATLRLGLQTRLLLLHLGLDSHVGRGLTFFDSMHGSLMLKPELRFSLPLGTGIGLDWGVAGYFLLGARGDTTIMEESGSTSTSDNTGGQTMTAIETSILLRVLR